MPANRRRILISIAAALTAATSATLAAPAQAAQAAPAQAGTSRFHHYVALGDSYTAVGNALFYGGGPIGCARSAVNYPHDLVAALGAGVSFTDASCGSATTDNMTQPQSVPLGVNAPQFDSLTADTDLVTVGIGGNDLGFVDVITECGLVSITNTFSNPCQQHYTAGGSDQLTAKINALAPKIDAVIQGIHQRAPHATVVVIGYLPVLPTSWGCWPSVPVAIGDVPWLNGVERHLDDMLASRAAANGALAVNPGGLTGHDACQWPWDRWVEPVIPASPTTPVHPNANGQSAVAQMIRSTVGI